MNVEHTMSAMSYLSLPLALGGAVLWVYLFAPIAFRLFGIHVPIASFYEPTEVLRGLGLARFITLYGVLTYAMAGFIYLVSNAFFEWRFSDAWALGFVPAPFNSIWRILLILVTSIAFGVLVAFLSWKRPSSSTTRLGV